MIPSQLAPLGRHPTASLWKSILMGGGGLLALFAMNFFNRQRVRLDMSGWASFRDIDYGGPPFWGAVEEEEFEGDEPSCLRCGFEICSCLGGRCNNYDCPVCTVMDGHNEGPP